MPPEFGFSRFFRSILFSSLARRIILINFIGLAVLLFGILYLNQFREGLIDARMKSLMTQAEIIAAAVASSNTIEPNALNIDPEKLLDLIINNDGVLPSDYDTQIQDYPINPERVGTVLSRLVNPTGTRARIFDRDGVLLMDSAHINARKPPVIEPKRSAFAILERIINTWFTPGRVATYHEASTIATQHFPEVEKALRGQVASVVRMQAETGSLVIFVAVPVQRPKGMVGALLLSTQGKDIDDVVTSERLEILRVFAVAGAVMLFLSLVLASTIATPLQRLSLAARRIRARKKLTGEFPDYSTRTDEIGELSIALHDMAESLEARIEAIERFAADVSHELKNPLTSLRSAIEVLPIVKKDEDRTRLLEVIHHDVQRLDRLISDISLASRLDAELQRADNSPTDVQKVLETVVNMANDMKTKHNVQVHLQVRTDGIPDGALEAAFYVHGNDSRLAQVASNLIDNAKSFSPPDGVVDVIVQRLPQHVRFMVLDSGRGIPPDNVQRIFERFYTDRPAKHFGNNSGLGLSISKQIVDAHGGEIYAENRKDNHGNILGACFTVDLPAAGWR